MAEAASSYSENVITTQEATRTSRPGEAAIKLQ